MTAAADTATLQPGPYRLIVEEMNQGAATLSRDGLILYTNRRLAELLETPLRNLIGSPIASFIPYAESAHWDSLLRNTPSNRGMAETTLRTVRGRLIPVQVATSRLPIEPDEAICLMVTDLTGQKQRELAQLSLMEDLAASKAQLEEMNRTLKQQIQERQLAEDEVRRLNTGLEQRVGERTRELAESEARFKAIAASTPDHLVVQDRDLRYTLVVNPQLGLTEAEMLGKSDEELLGPAGQGLTVLKRRVMATRQLERLLVPLTNRHGETEYFEGAYVPKIGADGTADGVIGYFRNVTERKLADQALREAQERIELGLLVGRAFAFEWIVATDEVRRSRHCAEILGIGGDATRDTGQDFFQRIHPDDRPRFVETATGLSPSQPRYSTEYRLVRPDGKIVTLHESAIAGFDASGKLARLIGMTADVTARVEAENAVAELNQKLKRRMAELQTVFDTAPIGLAISNDPEGRHIHGNTTIERMLGVEPGGELSQGAPQPPPLRITSEGRELPVRDLPLQRACRGETVIGQITEIERQDGRVVKLHCSAAPLFDENGSPRGGVGAFLDITEAKRAEEAVRQSELRFRTIFDTAPVSIWLQDWNPVAALLRGLREQGVTDFPRHFAEHPEFVAEALTSVRVLDINQWTIAMFGARDKEETIAQRAAIFSHPDSMREFAQVLATYADGQRFCRMEMSFHTVSGEAIHGLITLSFPAAGASPDTPAGQVLVCVIDITKRRQAEIGLRNLTEELKRTNQELESFSYSISHDLRAPLRAIDGFSRILLRECAGTLRPEHRAHLDRVRMASQRMAQLIDDLLQLSQTTRSALKRVAVDLSAIATAVIEEIRRGEPDRNVTVVIQPHLLVQADPTLLRAAIENLLANAWKFTRKQPEPRIEVGMKQVSGERVYYVRDNGIGFEMAYAGKLFAPFQRLHSSSEFPGTGIGLATVHRIVRRHGGRTWAEATPGAGASFLFTLPNSDPCHEPKTHPVG